MIKEKNMKLRIINKSDNKVLSYGNPDDAADYLFGRNLTNFLVIKSDERGDRLVPLCSTDDFVETRARLRNTP
jgi:hypothetical protein